MTKPAEEKAQRLLEAREPLLRREMPELDTIRGLAILGVLLYHGLYWQVDLSHFPRILRMLLTSMWVGRLGVNLFFVLSGFLITGILMESRGGNSYYKRFYVRRALRILPIYLVVLGILTALKLVPLAFTVLSLFYLSNLTPLFGVPLAYPVLWSLAVEEHFYFLFPTAVRHLKNKSLIALCGLVIAASPLSRLFSFLWIEHRYGFVSYKCADYTWNSLDGLACGALLAVLLREYRLSRRTLWACACAGFAIAVVGFLVGVPLGILDRHTAFGAALQVVPFHLAFTSLLVIFLLVGTGPWRAAVQIPFLIFLGYISYGLYLIHLLAFNFVDWIAGRQPQALVLTGIGPLLLRLLCAASLSIAVAFLSRKYLEERFLRLKDRLTGAQAGARNTRDNSEVVATPLAD